MSSSIDALVNREYQYGFTTDIEADTLPPGLSEDTVRFISAKKQEPQWLLDWRLKAFRRWQTMTGSSAVLEGDGRSFDEVATDCFGSVS